MNSNLDGFADNLQNDIINEIKRAYSEKVLEHWMHPRNLSDMENPDGFAEYAGLCGDIMKMYLKVMDNRVVEATFLTEGCGTTTACGSMTTELVTGKYVSDAWQITNETILEALGGLPQENQHCAALAATTLHMALMNYEKMQKEPWKKNYPKNE